MLSFGLPTDMFPIADDGSLKIGNHKKFLTRRRKLESLLNSPTAPSSSICKDASRVQRIIDLPRRNDVLLGRGRPFFTHSGNLFLQDLIDQRQDEYDQKKQGEKLKIRKEIASMVQAFGGRFLRQTSDGWWVEVDEDTVLGKIGHAFRTGRKRGREEKASKTIKRGKPDEKTANFHLPFSACCN